MNNGNTYFDLCVAGGGLAGLSTAIQMARAGYRVALFEKEKFPFHKVCGEYISMESCELLIDLGIPLHSLEIPWITRLCFSSSDGSFLKQALPAGGLGISRYTIDHLLAQNARKCGVEVFDGTRVQDIVFSRDGFDLNTTRGTFRSKLCCAAFGKRSNLDIKWQREFLASKQAARNQFLGVKYHAVLDHPRDMISLHNFPGGYCGLAPVEDNKTCVRYLTTADKLRVHRNDLHGMERDLLSRNPFLRASFDQASLENVRPLVTSQISFQDKEQVFRHMLLLGDSAGLITPLCGNGMSMALHSSKIAVESMRLFLAGKSDRSSMEYAYAFQWKQTFRRRLVAGRMLQSLFLKAEVTNLAVKVLQFCPGLVSRIIRQTHG